MKRRNADCGKLRRPIKRNKIADGMYGSTTVLYMKFLILWAIVITADFMFMFRFEFLWPFWLLLRSVHDSFKYKGLAFSVLFVCIAITSDLVCLFFIPVHWLLFAASTYVWVQYVWHTDKGICLPTIILWMLFVYLEAGIRWKDSRHMPHLDLCRPFAAHCIGYPVVTLGFGFKSYVGYRMRQRKQREVAKENEFYMQLLQQALPQEEPTVTAAVSLVDGTATTTSPSQPQLTGVHATANSLVAATTNSNSIMQSAQTNSNLNNHHQQHNHHSHSNHHTPSTSPSSSLSVISMSSALSPTSAAAAIAGLAATTATTTTSTTTTLNAHNNSGSSGVMLNGNISSGLLSTHNHSQQHNHHQLHPTENHHHHANSSNNNNNSHNASNSNNNNNNNNTNSAHTSNGSISLLTPTTSSSSSSSVSGTAISSTTPIIMTSPDQITATSNLDDKHYVQIGNGNGGSVCASPSSSSTSTSSFSSFNAGGVTLNGHVGKSHKRSIDKENKNRSIDSENSSKSSKGSATGSGSGVDHMSNNHLSSSKTDWDNANYNQQQQNVTVTQNSKERHYNHQHSNHSDSGHPSKKTNSSATSNGNVLQYDAEEIVTVEPVERTKGRRNRAKKDNAAKDNHHNNNNNNNNNTTHNNNNHNSDASSVSSSTSTTSGSTTANTGNNSSSAAVTAASSISTIAAKVVSKICESCLKFEADIKKYRSEINHMKSIEKELRQKLDANQDMKNCLQAKQKECDDLEKRVAELNNLRHTDHKTAERRLAEERRQKQSLEAQLNNEKKARKMAEEKAARPECSAQCRQRKLQMDEEIKQLRRDLKQAEDGKQMAEQHGRKYEQELRMIEAEIRNRDSNQHEREVLMNAIAAMQDKNCTLEKNLSAETRVKLDLFSALGDAKRQLEISESRRRSNDEEILDLKAKIAQLLAVMPSDALCMPPRNSTGAGSMLRMNDTPPLQTCPGPASPMLSSLNAGQAPNSVSNHQLASRVPTSATDYVHQQAPTDYQQHHHPQHNQHHPHQQHQSHQPPPQQIVPVSVAASVLVNVTGNNMNGNVAPGNSSLDPNATVYKPKTGAEA